MLLILEFKITEGTDGQPWFIVNEIVNRAQVLLFRSESLGKVGVGRIYSCVQILAMGFVQCVEVVLRISEPLKGILC